MWFRDKLNQRTPVREGEAELPPEVSRLVFRGCYLFQTRIVGVTQVDNDDPRTKHGYPFRVVITRENSEGRRTEASRDYDESQAGIVAQTQDEGILERASRIESRARRAKVGAAAGALLVAVAAGLWAWAHSGSDEVPVGEPCDQLADETVAFLPLTPDQAQVAQDIGQATCVSAKTEYLVLELAE